MAELHRPPMQPILGCAVNSTYVKKLRLRQDLQALRSEYHLTQEQLAKKAGVSRGDMRQGRNGAPSRTASSAQPSTATKPWKG